MKKKITSLIQSACEPLSFPHNTNIKSAYTLIYKNKICSETN